MTNIETLTPKNQESWSNQWGPPHISNNMQDMLRRSTAN